MRAVGGSRRKSSLVFNFRFANQHHRDVVANGINAAALAALQSLAAFSQIDRCLTKWTNEDLKQLGIHSHKKVTS